MPRRRTPSTAQGDVADFRHDEARRKKNPPAGMAPTYEVRERKVQTYSYDPHRAPQLQWAGKAEHISFDVDVVSLHIHERISTRAIIDAVRRSEPTQLSLFADTPLPLDQQIEFYQHNVNWANRLILGYSLLVMNSLLVKEGMGGKVQMIYIDPPYGISYSSNFQPRIDGRDVKDHDQDLTHEPEQIKAYRDTWRLGVHSYLTYLRDRLLLARELLTESGSIFVQINDENLHLVRCLLDEVFGRESFVAVIAFQTAANQNTEGIQRLFDHLVWYARNIGRLRPYKLFRERTDEDIRTVFPRTDDEGKRFKSSDASSRPAEEIARLCASDRLTVENRAKMFPDDFPRTEMHNVWADTVFGHAKAKEKVYAVQTNTKVIERCILMTTDPGDLVFDPTCVRKGTRVYAPLTPPDIGGTPRATLPDIGEGQGGVLIPIESIRPGDLVLGHDGKPHRVLRTICRPYHGTMIGIRHRASPLTLWVTADHRILCQIRTRSYGADRTWRHVPTEHFQWARDLRRQMTPPERRLWSALRGEQLGVKFRKQHPIGPYIADFYSWEAGMVVEVDGDGHYTASGQAYDSERDAYLRSLGLTVLRFTNRDVTSNLSGVVDTIAQTIQSVQPSADHYHQWRRADSLRVGDVVYSGPAARPTEITNIFSEQTAEDVYDLEVEGAHSFITEVCVVHNCGSGTTAYCAEKWGRRWITCDSSRVALAIARQRLMTAKYDYYELKDPERGPAGCFHYETVPHITLKSIAHNTEIDTIAAKYQPDIDAALALLKEALGKDWKEWEVPREAPGAWPQSARDAHQLFWEAKRSKRREIDASIQRNAPR